MWLSVIDCHVSQHPFHSISIYGFPFFFDFSFPSLSLHGIFVIFSSRFSPYLWPCSSLSFSLSSQQFHPLLSIFSFPVLSIFSLPSFSSCLSPFYSPSSSSPCSWSYS